MISHVSPFINECTLIWNIEQLLHGTNELQKNGVKSEY